MLHYLLCFPFTRIKQTLKLQIKDRKLSIRFKSSFPYIDDAMSPNNSRFGDYLTTVHYEIPLSQKEIDLFTFI